MRLALIFLLSGCSSLGLVEDQAEYVVFNPLCVLGCNSVISAANSNAVGGSPNTTQSTTTGGLNQQ